jgi:hypothetical protein
MKLKILFTSFLYLAGCGQVYNSNTFDQYNYGANGISDPVFAEAYSALKVRCMNCHVHAGWSAYTTEAQWTSAGLVIPGSPSTSTVITRLKNSGGDMPTDSGAIPNAEKIAIETWINAL